MGVGELTADDKKRINTVVALAEEETGLEFCVIVTHRRGEDQREEAERLFHKIGMHERPAVMVMVVPEARTLDIVTAADVAERVTDNTCDEAVRLMSGLFATGDMVGGLERGVQLLAERAGARTDGREGHVGPDLPNVLDTDDPE